MTDDVILRDAYEELLVARTPGDRGACPPPEALLAIIERTGNETDRLGTLDHVMTCVRCRRDLDLLRTAAVAAGETLSEPVATLSFARSGTSRRFPLRPLAIAAGLVVAVGIGLLSRKPGERPPLLRGSEHTVVLVPPEHRSDGSTLLRWRPLPGALRYRVEVFAPTGRTVVSDTVADSTFLLSATASADPGEQLRWMVTALHGDGHEVHSRAERVEP